MSAPTTTPSHAPLLESLEMLERAVAYTRVQLQAVTREMLCLPTPCERWRLGALLDHMADSLDALTEAADLHHVSVADRPEPAGPPSPLDVVERLQVRACSLLGAWSAVARDDDVMVGDRPLSSSVLACAGALEVAVHGWDVSQATGVRAPIPAALARELLIWADVLVGDADRPERFDHPLSGPSVGPSSRLLMSLGREP
jgi:uncharacterized protein (TIGR03086 family)